MIRLFFYLLLPVTSFHSDVTLHDQCNQFRHEFEWKIQPIPTSQGKSSHKVLLFECRAKINTFTSQNGSDMDVNFGSSPSPQRKTKQTPAHKREGRLQHNEFVIEL